MSIKRVAVRRLVPACLGVLWLGSASFAAAPAEKPQVPNWELRCADGSQVDFHAALAKGPVLVSFWATWCKPCLKELPHLDRLARDFEGRLTVLAVNIDSQRSVAKVRPFLHAKGYKLQVPLDTSGDTRRLLQVGNMVPFLVLYGAQGQEVYRHVGYKEGDEKTLRRAVEDLLGGAKTPAGRDAGEGAAAQTPAGSAG